MIELYDIRAVVYTGISFITTSQDSLPQGLVFNNDGSKLFIIGSANDCLYGYDLGVNFDVSTAVYIGEKFIISGQAPVPTDLAFNNDGSKVYVVGAGTASIHAFDLGTNFDISTAFNNGENFHLGTQDTSVTGITFNNHGSKLYMVASTTAKVFAYNLGVDFDVSTAVYDGENFLVSGQDISPTGIVFSNDGTKFYISGLDTDTIYAYSLNTAYNLSTANYDDEFIDISDQDTGVRGLTITGTPDIENSGKMHIIGVENSSIYTYIIPVPEGVDKIIKLTNQLYPTGRAWKLDFKSIFRKLHEGLGYSEARAINYTKDILNTILPDNENFTVENAERWEIALGLLSDPLLTLEQRKLLIERKMQHPGNIPARQHYLYLQGQLQAAGFDVYVHEYITNPIIPIVAIHGTFNFGATTHGNLGLLGGYEIIANFIDSTKDEDNLPGLIENLNSSFFIGGEIFPARANVPLLQKQIFRELVLKIKPANTGGFLLIDYT